MTEQFYTPKHAIDAYGWVATMEANWANSLLRRVDPRLLPHCVLQVSHQPAHPRVFVGLLLCTLEESGQWTEYRLGGAEAMYHGTKLVWHEYECSELEILKKRFSVHLDGGV